jgi:pyruvate, water dikinase
LEKKMNTQDQRIIIPFDELRLTDLPLVGGKNSSLGEMISQLSKVGIKVPMGFATTSFAYRKFMEESGLFDELGKLFRDLNPSNISNLQTVGHEARTLVTETPFPNWLNDSISESYQKLCDIYGTDTSVAVRSSATAEDLPDASFAGQQETFLCVQTIRRVLYNTHRCFASIFTDRAISQRAGHGFDHFEVSLSAGIQKMVRSDLAISGVMFSIDTETGFKNAVLVTGSYGLGEPVVQGEVNPDEYLVFKPTLLDGYSPILEKRCGSKEVKLIYDVFSRKTEKVDVEQIDRINWAVNDDEILQLARWACLIEEHYTNLKGVYTPMDIEWAKDGITGELFIVQARPETVHSKKFVLKKNELVDYVLDEKSEVLATGRGVGSKIGSGNVKVILNIANLSTFQEGDVLVTSRTDPDWEPAMRKASAIITNTGGRTCHAAILARELGVPAVIACGDATEVLTNGQPVTVSCAEGDDGKVFKGILKYHENITQLGNLPQTKTAVLMNMADPAQAFHKSAIPVGGVGLARLEFVIERYIKIHPLALLNYDSITDLILKKQIDDITSKYNDKKEYFVSRLARGIAMIAAAFYPNPVIVRNTDLKSNEYSNLLGGKLFEPVEENPMIGWRGASRYYHPRYEAAFALECEAYRKVRDEMGFTNVIPMIPFCRTVEEGQKVLDTMAKYGLSRGYNGLQVYMMVEIPSNVILLPEFCDIFDGFSIGSNDLTQLTMGLDRDSADVIHVADERNLAVKRLISLAIRIAKSKNKKIGFCGQAPSDYPDFLEFLVMQGINSISLNEDTVVKSILQIHDIESRTNKQNQFDDLWSEVIV